MTTDPARILSAGSGASDVLKDLVRAAREEAPSPAQLDRVEAHFAGLAVAPAAVAGVKAAVTAKAASAWTWLAVAAVGAGVTGGAVWYTRPPSPPAVALARPGPVLPARVAEPLPVAPVAKVLPAPRPTSSHARPVRPPEPATPPTPPESTLLDQAFGALRSGDASQALSLAQEHQRAYPHGLMEEEREAIEIEALTKLGRMAEARQRLTAFEGRHAGSGYAWRLEALVSP